MPRLTGLPPELLREILWHVDNDAAEEREYADHGHPGLCALALTGGRLAEAATALLYEKITIERNGDDAKDAQRLVLLNRSCRANPKLVHRICSAELRWSHHVDETPHYDEFLAHLARGNTLVSLDSELSFLNGLLPTDPVAAGANPLPALYEWQPGGFAVLRELSVELNHAEDQARVPVASLVRLCEMPALREITLCAPAAVDHDDFDDYGSDVGDKRLPTIGLTELCFGYGRPVSATLLRQVLPRSPVLQTLQMGLPGAAIEVNRKFCDYASSGGYDLRGPVLSPRSIGRLLAPVAASLEQLTLHAENVGLPARHDGSQIDLTAFTRLRQLEITACLLFGDGSGAVASGGAGGGNSDDIWRRLPPALENLTIHFDGDLGLFWSMTEMRSHLRAGTFESQLWDRRLCDDGGENDGLRWLAELLRRHTSGELPGNQLRAITLEEREVYGRDRNWALVTWRQPGGDRLRHLARAAAVDLEISLRVPRSFQSEEFEAVEKARYYGEPGTVWYPGGSGDLGDLGDNPNSPDSHVTSPESSTGSSPSSDGMD
ncbi:hypothetical protein PG999_005961 [Apiospora kogelbergensis]|uniref:Uncharacterized protein n=1 Tax=Apiospora kogelbergensis TaxID=1337665 RepID=A0AAW0QQW0_9PEZI